MRITEFTPHQSGAMLGFFRVATPSGLGIPDFRAMRNQAGDVWVGVPNRPAIDAGRVVIGDNGKRLYIPTLFFRDKATEKRFLDQVREALRRDYPELFAGGGAR
jgi:hypothetical protein